MTKLLAAFALFLIAAPIAGQDATPTIETLRARAQERMRQDLAIYSREDMRTLEELYQSANRNLRSPDAKGILQRVVKQYPKSNRAGSAVLYLAQMSSGPEREAYLKTAIKDHGDTWYGNGVQVGAFARAQLAAYYAANDKLSDAKKLAKEVEERFPGAVDHGGRSPTCCAASTCGSADAGDGDRWSADLLANILGHSSGLAVSLLAL